MTVLLFYFSDENWEHRVHQFRRTFQGHRPTVRFEKLRPAATHPNLGKY